MRDDWTETTLDELVLSGVILLGRGNVISKKDMEADPGPFPVYSSAQNNDGRIGTYNQFMFDEELITWSVDGGGYVFYRKHHKFSVTNIGGYLRILDKSKFLYPFLAAVLQKLHSEHVFDWQNKAHPSVIRKLYNNIPLAPIAEQKRIVDIVSSVDAYIDALQQHVDAARTARNAVLHELLTAGGDDWTETTLGEVGEAGLFTDGDWVESKDQDPAGDYRLLQLADIGDGVFLNKSSRYMNDVQFKRLRCTPLRHRDILIARMPDPIARACLFPPDMPVSATVVDVAILRCEDPYSAEFLVLAINDVRFREAAQALLTGTTRQRISRSNLSKIIVNLPPISEQKRIVEIVSSMDDVIQAAERAVVEAKNLRSGLLSDLLSGEHEIPVSYDQLLGAA